MPKYEISCPITGFLNQIHADFGVLHDVDVANEPWRIIGYYTFPVVAESEEDALKKAQSVFDELWDNGEIDCGDVYNIDRTVYENGDEYRCCGIAEQENVTAVNKRSIFTFTLCCLMLIPFYTLSLIMVIIGLFSNDPWWLKILMVAFWFVSEAILYTEHLQVQKDMDAIMTAVQKSSRGEKKMAKIKLILAAIATFTICMTIGSIAIPSTLTWMTSHSC